MSKILINAIISETIDGGTPQSFTYDDAGRLTDDGTLTYDWDRADRLLETDDGVTTIAYEYNGLGHRVRQDTTDYLLDTVQGLPRVIADKNGSTINRYVFSDHGLLRHQKPDSSWVHPLRDGLGSVRHIVDASLDPVYSVNHTPYGELWNAQGTSPMPFGFTGEWQDSNDLLFLRARYYNPAQAAFLSLDPLEGGLGVIRTLNRFGYVYGDPINLTDPSGLVGEVPPIGCGGGFPRQGNCDSMTHTLTQEVVRRLQEFDVNIANICDWEAPTRWQIKNNPQSNAYFALDTIKDAVEDTGTSLANFFGISTPENMFREFMPASINLVINNQLGSNKLMESNPNGTIEIKYSGSTSIDNLASRQSRSIYTLIIHEFGHMVDFSVTEIFGYDPVKYSVVGTDLFRTFAENLNVWPLYTGLTFTVRSNTMDAEFVADVLGNWFADTIVDANMQIVADTLILTSGLILSLANK